MTRLRATPALRIVAAEPVDFTREIRVALSAACGKRIGDDMRAEIMRRFDPMCHVRGDRAEPLRLPAGWRAPR